MCLFLLPFFWLACFFFTTNPREGSASAAIMSYYIALLSEFFSIPTFLLYLYEKIFRTLQNFFVLMYLAVGASRIRASVHVSGSFKKNVRDDDCNNELIIWMPACGGV